MSPLGSIPLSPLSLLPEIFDFFFFFLATLVFVAAHQISLVSDSGYCSLVAGCAGFSLRWLLLLWRTGCRHMGTAVAVCRLKGTGSAVVVHGLNCCAASGIFPDQG